MKYLVNIILMSIIGVTVFAQVDFNNLILKNPIADNPYIRALEKPVDTINGLLSENWDNIDNWSVSKDGSAIINTQNYDGINNDGIEISWNFSNGIWLDLTTVLSDTLSSDYPIVFFIQSSLSSSDILEIKFTDTDGSVFGKKVPLENFSESWNYVVIYLNNTSYWWGGIDEDFGTFSKFSIAISGNGTDTVWFDEIGIGKPGLETDFPVLGSPIDPNRELDGIGFLQRRDLAINDEDPLIMSHLKKIQDISSNDQNILPSMENDNDAQTFNNCLVAISYIIKGEKERAERILDFYANATDKSNTDIRLQNFYYNGEARGFYQHVSLNTMRDESASAHRWMKDLLLSYYTDAPVGGYIKHGWRNGDSYLHEPTGHHEGNIDCYVVMKLCGEEEIASKIKAWLENELDDQSKLPLDLYAWRVLAYGDTSYADLLNIPEYDFRYRKIIEINNDTVMGFYQNSDFNVNNLWNDGTGHMACAYLAFGEKERGYFYANQMDKLIIERELEGDITHAIPYTLNAEGGFEWVDLNKGFTSSIAWYIFAKNSHNPFLSENNYANIPTGFSSIKASPSKSGIFPNPFQSNLNIEYSLLEKGHVLIEVFDLQGRKINTLVDSEFTPGIHLLNWSGTNTAGKRVESGIYFIQLKKDNQNTIYQVSFLGE